MKEVAKKKEKSKRVKRLFGASMKWVINNLSASQLKDLDERYPDAETILQFLLECSDSGLDVKTSWDTFSGCYSANAIGAWEDTPNSGYAASGRSARDVHDALAVVWYKLVIVAAGDLSSVLDEDQAENLRG